MIDVGDPRNNFRKEDLPTFPAASTAFRPKIQSVLIDHQPYQLANLNSHDPQAVVNLTTALAKLAKAFNVPTILTSVIAGRGGLLFKQITDVFPGQEVIDRTWVNTWQDEKVVDAVKATGRKQLIIAGLWTEVCVAMPVIQPPAKAGT